MASKIRLIWFDIWMISPLIKHSYGMRKHAIKKSYIEPSTEPLPLKHMFNCYYYAVSSFIRCFLQK
jgi:hypothetical protein